MNPRDLFIPKLPEMPLQCASCPFREGNDITWGIIVRKLAMFGGVGKPNAARARRLIRLETTRIGDFICHGTAYNADMSFRSAVEHRQCPGATKWFRGSHP